MCIYLFPFGVKEEVMGIMSTAASAVYEINKHLLFMLLISLFSFYLLRNLKPSTSLKWSLLDAI